ncbi:hypothetical protein MKS88_003429 [Plasmodium brasilianum]|uniref:Uncharacterized protein n=2 Tax=Plasmodium (Plasmodium) TaxID=418103 RepID=A0A1D3RJ79_PLAMA|nr:conserved Plasmodium protein, unknown function [Plasmodium malariae]KAI4838007.1 hypothetical protein MKS88_003429 [Plasmodium brasilianum]SCN45255.1 conserved Plasmodium protein, unknown function [Plasmodium malariae]
MFFNKYRKKFKNTKRRYCGVPEISRKEGNNSFLPILGSDSLKELILRDYFKIILESVYDNFQKNNYFFEVFIYVDIIKLVDSISCLGYYLTKNFVAFANSFNEISYSLLSEFLQSFKNERPNSDMIEYLNVLIKSKFFTITLIPTNTPVKVDCILNLAKSYKLENNFYNVIELINAILICQDKRSFLYKSIYMRICECSNKYLPHQNVIVKMNKLGDIIDKKEGKEICKLCFTKEYEEITSKRQFKNFFLLKFSFTKTLDEYSNIDECTTFEVLYQDIPERTETFETGMKYNLIVVSIPNQPNKNSIKGSRVSNLWLLNYWKHNTKKFGSNLLALPEKEKTSLSTEIFNDLLQSQNLDDMNKIIVDILKMPNNNSCLSKICKTTKLTLILISICSNFLKYSKMDIFAYDIYNKIKSNKWLNPSSKGHTLARVRAPHCFFICLDEIIMKDLVKFCNYFCNIKLLNVKKDSFNILLTQKYDILVININNLSNSQINVLVELMKNGIYKNKKCFFPISTTFWVYAVKPYIRNEQEFNAYIKEDLLARFDFLFELSFEDVDDLIDEILKTTDDVENKNFDFYFELNNKYSYLKKSNLSNFEFSEMSDITKSIIQKYFNMAADLSTLTIYHIGICELLCISVSILLGKNECLIEHVVLGLFLYDTFVSSKKNELTQFDKNILKSIIDPPNNESTSFQKLMNYFSSYINATVNL